MTDIRKCSFLSLFAFLLIAGPSFGQSTIEEYLEKFRKLKPFSGTVVVSIKDEVILHKGFGYADYEHSVRNTKSSVHRIGSLTKPITAMALLKLFGSSNSFSIEDSIGKFLPKLPEAWKQVTVFQLLTHTSGISDYFGDLDAVPVEDTYQEIEKVFNQEKAGKLNSIPGQTYRYNNFGYVLIGRIIEVVSKKNYADYLKEAIFDPLEMENTTYDDPRLIIHGRSEGYRLANDSVVNDALKDPAAYAAGGLLSTTDDLLKWSRSLKTDIILDKSQREAVFTPNKGNYGLGWQIVQKDGRLMYNHNGGTHGYNTRLVYYPEEDVFIAVLGNNEDIRAAALTCDMEALIFDNRNHVFAFPYELPKNQLQKFAGEYQTDSGKKRIIELIDDQLYYINGNSKYKLTPLSENLFCLSKYEDIRLEFIDKNTLEISYCSVNPETYIRN